METVRELVSVRHRFLHPSLLILWIIAEWLALISLVLIIYWAKEFYVGFAWDGSGKEFNYHPVFMTLGLVIIYGNCKYNDFFIHCLRITFHKEFIEVESILDVWLGSECAASFLETPERSPGSVL